MVILLLVLLEIGIGASWWARQKEVQPLLSWENGFISQLSISQQFYQVGKLGFFIIVLIVLIVLVFARRKPQKYKLPKM